MRGDPGISPIYRMGEAPAASDPLEQWGRLESMRRKAWRMRGVIAVTPGELPDGLSQELEAWAVQQYGER